MREEYSFSELKFNPLFTALAEGSGIAKNFYPDINPLATRIRETCEFIGASFSSTPSRRKKLVDILRKNHPLAEQEEVKKNLDLAVQPNSFFIVTGQQVGFLGGPLLTLIKTCSAVALAKKLNDAIKEFNFIPLLWAGGLDHDFEEVKDFFYIGSNNTLTKVSAIQPFKTIGFELSSIKIGKENEEIVKKASAELASSSADFLDVVKNSYSPEKTFTQAFINLFAQIFRRSGLLFTDAGDAQAKSIADSLYIESAEKWREQRDELTRATIALKRMGFAPQLKLDKNETNLFLLDESGVRRKLLAEDDTFHFKATKRENEKHERFSFMELKRIAEEEPARISFNVVLRPLYQQTLIPAVCYIGGPSEVAYWAQIYPLFGLHKIARPLLLPRPSFTLVSAHTRRILDKYSLHLLSLMEPEQAQLSRILAEFIPPMISERITELRKLFLNHSIDLKAEIGKLDATLEKTIENLIESFYKYLGKIEKKVVRSIKERNGIIVQQIKSVYALLMPEGKLQERTLGGLYFLFTYGEEVVERIIDACEFPPKAHKLLMI